jgi:hypothetical protein
MCYGWYEEKLLWEREIRARLKAEELKRSAKPATPAQEAEKKPKPERQKETQPDVVPA